MRSSLIVKVSLLLLVLLNVSFRWPVDQGRMTSTFGESRGDHFHDGLDTVSQNGKIYPIHKGSLLYYWDQSIFPLENAPGGGNYKVLDHGDGLASIYMHLLPGTGREVRYDEKTLVGMMGNSGHSYSRHLHFSLLDLKTRKSLNLLSKLPEPEPKDGAKPEVEDFLLKIDDRYIILRKGSEIRLTQHYPLLIKIRDTISGRENLGIYKLQVEHNGKVVSKMTFDALDYGNGGLTNGGHTFDQVFDPKGYYKIKDLHYTEGENTFLVKATDYNGNSTEATFHCTVMLDME